MIALFSPDADALPPAQREAIERVCAMAAAKRSSFEVVDFAKRRNAARKGWQKRRANG